MIVTASEDGWRCITQPDHAHLAQDILALWRTDGLPDHPRREALLRAVLEHDNGWQEADAAPLLEGSSRPVDFLNFPLSGRFDVWRRGIARHRESQPYVAALILEHARYLHQVQRTAGVETSAPWDGFLDELDTLWPLLLAEAELDATTLETDYRWLHLADLLSLTVCAGWSEPFERYGMRGQLKQKTLELAPFPLVGATRFSVPCRILPRRVYPTATAMATALATSRWQSLDLRLAPGAASTA